MAADKAKIAISWRGTLVMESTVGYDPEHEDGTALGEHIFCGLSGGVV